MDFISSHCCTTGDIVPVLVTGWCYRSRSIAWRRLAVTPLSLPSSFRWLLLASQEQRFLLFCWLLQRLPFWSLWTRLLRQHYDWTIALHFSSLTYLFPFCFAASICTVGHEYILLNKASTNHNGWKPCHICAQPCLVDCLKLKIPFLLLCCFLSSCHLIFLCAATICTVAYEYIVPANLIWVVVVPAVFIMWQTGKLPGPYNLEFWLIAYFGVYKKCWQDIWSIALTLFQWAWVHFSPHMKVLNLQWCDHCDIKPLLLAGYLGYLTDTVSVGMSRLKTLSPFSLRMNCKAIWHCDVTASAGRASRASHGHYFNGPDQSDHVSDHVVDKIIYQCVRSCVRPDHF